MDGFLHTQNIARFRDLLLRTTDPEQRKQIQYLLAEEEAKELPSGLAPLRDLEAKP